MTLSSITDTNLLSVGSTCGVTYPDQNNSTALVTIKIDMEVPPSYTLGFLTVIRFNSFDIIRPVLPNVPAPTSITPTVSILTLTRPVSIQTNPEGGTPTRTGLAKGQVAGIVVGVLSFLAIVICCGYCIRKRILGHVSYVAPPSDTKTARHHPTTASHNAHVHPPSYSRKPTLEKGAADSAWP